MPFDKVDDLSERMVRTQIQTRGIINERLCSIMKRIPRHLFISGIAKEKAYGDHPISIGHGQTISQPYIVALMTDLLSIQKNDKVLEIGTGSGYQTAVLAELSEKVYTIERIHELSKHAQLILNGLGYDNIYFIEGDGSIGYPEQGPFDKIIVTAAAPIVPEELKNQLSDNGILVIPVGDYRSYQVINVIRRIGTLFEVKESIGCRFVPLIGKYAFDGE
ncbi:MAG: protein-L-isoaspartate(D-aspartate) O-methyltransferase [Spirochaetales bacterium]|nr:protein-L-isoaspartate(D-aspartate) O-methyltransferase [Spirochaetales bacterium]